MEARKEEVVEVRNICIVAHVDHGKTTLVDSLVRQAGLSHKERALDHAKKEQVDRNITMTATGATLDFTSSNVRINLIDSPGHVDFSGEVTAALRLSDGCVVVVDAAAGVKVQTGTVIRQALQERVRPVLVVNKLDRLLGGSTSGEDAYLKIAGIIEQVNAMIERHIGTWATEEERANWRVDPAKGSVLLGAGKEQWGVTLTQMADAMVESGKGGKREDALKAMWGEVYWREGKWSGKRGSKGSVRGFEKLVWEPLRKAYKAAQEEADWEKCKLALKEAWGWERKTEKAEPKLEMGSKTNAQNALGWLMPLADVLVKQIKAVLPSPAQAQMYRMSLLAGTERPGDITYEGALACNKEAPLCVYVAKTVATSQGEGAMWGLCRVLSGTLKRGSKVKCMAGEEKGGQERQWREATIQSLALPLGADVEQIDRVEAGQIGLIGGVGSALGRFGTIVDGSAAADHWALRDMSFAVSAVVARSVRPAKPSDLPAFQKGLQRLLRTDNVVQVTHDPQTRETTVSGVGELHLEVALGDLKRYAGVELVIGTPIVALRETCIASSEAHPALAKSSNKLNRVWTACAALDEERTKALELEGGNVASLGLAVKEQKSVWRAGGECGPNVLQDDTKAVDYLQEARGFMETSFARWTQQGPLCGEPVRGVRLSVTDCTLHQDRAHRGAGELLEACRRSYSGAMLTAEPRLLEPVLQVTVEVPIRLSGVIYGFLAGRRGRVQSENVEQGHTSVIVAHVPALECITGNESKGFDEALKAATSGEAFCSMEFSHWEIIPSDPLEEGTFANKLMKESRKRKKLPDVLDVTAFIDKL